MDVMSGPEPMMAIARFIGIVAPTLYCGKSISTPTSVRHYLLTARLRTGISAFDSLILTQSIVTHAPDQKSMAKLWYFGYKYGPLWVPPIIGPGTLANLYLAYLSSPTDTTQRSLYITAAAGIFSILPILFGWMEPGINGASKWKVQLLLKDEGFSMPETSIWRPSARKHSATPASRRWAEKVDMQDLIRSWQKWNNARWVIAGVSAVLSGWATFGM